MTPAETPPLLPIARQRSLLAIQTISRRRRIGRDPDRNSFTAGLCLLILFGHDARLIVELDSDQRAGSSPQEVE
jgi:hypothetical protein